MSRTLLCVALLGLLPGLALADPSSPPDEKPWSYDFGRTRTTITENEPNDICPGVTFQKIIS